MSSEKLKEHLKALPLPKGDAPGTCLRSGTSFLSGQQVRMKVQSHDVWGKSLLAVHCPGSHTGMQRTPGSPQRHSSAEVCS